MSFVDKVAQLRALLDIPPELTLAAAVTKMSALMGLPTLCESGALVPLPDQVARLQESLGVGDASQPTRENDARSAPVAAAAEQPIAAAAATCEHREAGGMIDEWPTNKKLKTGEPSLRQSECALFKPWRPHRSPDPQSLRSARLCSRRCSWNVLWHNVGEKLQGEATGGLLHDP